MLIQSSLVNALIALLVLTTAARADDAASAREHFRRGTTAYDLGRYAEAAGEYERAYEFKNEPALLFNIGQAYRGAGDYDKAIIAYRSYLRNTGDAPNRTEVEARILEMQHQLAEKRKTAENPPRGTLSSETLKPAPLPVAVPPRTAPNDAIRVAPPIPVRNGRAQRTAGLAFGGAGVALIALGGAFVGLAKSANDAITSSGTFDASAQDRRNAFQSADIACFVIGGTAVAGGLTLYLIARSGKR